MNRLEHYLRHERLYVFAMLFCFLGVETTINASSLLMEAMNEGNTRPGWAWFALEYTSGLAMIALFPLVLLIEKRFPLGWPVKRKHIVAHLAGTLAFTVLHIVLMTLLRKLVFAFAGIGYSLNDLSWQLLYEYRKDAWT